MAKALKKFTVVLSSDRGYFEYQVKAKDHLHAKVLAKEECGPGIEDDEHWHASSVVVISGWPETWVGD